MVMLRIDHPGAQTASPDKLDYFALDGGVVLAGNSSSINFDFAMIRNDIRLCSTADRTDVDGRVSEEWMFPAAQRARVIIFEQLHDFRHLMHRVPTQFRAGAMC